MRYWFLWGDSTSSMAIAGRKYQRKNAQFPPNADGNFFLPWLGFCIVGILMFKRKYFLFYIAHLSWVENEVEHHADILWTPLALYGFTILMEFNFIVVPSSGERCNMNRKFLSEFLVIQPHFGNISFLPTMKHKKVFEFMSCWALC